MNVTDRGAQCNRAIMIITDGAPDTYEEIFAKYNWPNKDVRTAHVSLRSARSRQNEVKLSGNSTGDNIFIFIHHDGG